MMYDGGSTGVRSGVGCPHAPHVVWPKYRIFIGKVALEGTLRSVTAQCVAVALRLPANKGPKAGSGGSLGARLRALGLGAQLTSAPQLAYLSIFPSCTRLCTRSTPPHLQWLNEVLEKVRERGHYM